jgi:membrane protease YdiL (CAAX protease family)
MSDKAAKKPLVKQAWLRVVLFGIGFAIITLLIAIPAVIAILYAHSKNQDITANLAEALPKLLAGNFLWLVVLLECVVSLLSVWIFRVFVDRRSFSSLGLRPDGYFSESVIGFFMGPALLGICSLGLLFSGHLKWVDISFDPQSLTISLGLLLLIAFSEELVFRGYVLGNLLETFSNKWVALAISAILFAIFHITNPGMHSLAFANLFLAGLLLGLNYIYTRNLWFSMLFHFSWNFFQGPLLGFNVSGLHLPSLLIAETKGDLMITGGEFGLEGSMLNTAISLTAVLVLGWAFEWKYRAANAASGNIAPGKPLKA